MHSKNVSTRPGGAHPVEIALSNSDDLSREGRAEVDKAMTGFVSDLPNRPIGEGAILLSDTPPESTGKQPWDGVALVLLP